MVLSAKRVIGNTGEDIACEYLMRKGFSIKERYFLKPWGEIDIIATKEGVYHFVEVKTISREKASRAMTNKYMTAEDHIHSAKLMKIARTVETYMANLAGDPDYQIDVVTVVLDLVTRKATCALYEQVL